MHTDQLGFRKARWEIIPNGFDTNRFRPHLADRDRIRKELDIPSLAPVVGLIGRYSPLKDHRNFLAAVSLLQQNASPAHYVLAGRDVHSRNRELMELCRSFGLDDRVHLLGERQDVPQLLSAIDVLTLSSFSECFPMVIGEAMACGVPCVSTSVGDVAAMIGDTGRIVPPRDPGALSAALYEMLRMPASERTQLGERARARIVQRYSMESVTRRFEELYSRCARRAPKTPRHELAA